jgi:lipoate-protein ligase A
MRCIRLTLPTPAENLALDEALLDWAEEENSKWEFLRLWESPQPMVVVGRSSRVHEEVYESACNEANVPILRRSSGGAAIVAGPGCLMYAVVLSYAVRPELKDIGRAHAFLLGRLADALTPLVQKHGRVVRAGTSDLAIEDKHFVQRKFSGNSMRAKRTHLLYHGTLMYGFDVSLIGRLLRMPPRQPEYRAARPHSDFLTNLPRTANDIMEAAANAWPITSELTCWPRETVDKLAAERYTRDAWNRDFR